MKKTLQMICLVTCTGLLGACGVPLDPIDTTDGQGALRCSDCPSAPPPLPPGPKPPTHPMVNLPMGDAFRVGRPVDIKDLTNRDVGFDYQGWETRDQTAWATVSASELTVSPTSNFRFSIKAIDGTACHVELYVNHFDFGKLGGGLLENYLDYSVNQDAYCYTTPFQDESYGNNNGIRLDLPDLDIHLWAKREDRLRITIGHGLGQSSNYLWQMEIDSDENK